MPRLNVIWILLLIPCMVVGEAADKQRLVVSLAKEQQLAVYVLDAVNGTLTLESRTDVSARPGAMCFNQKGDRLYVVLKESGALAAFQMEKMSPPRLLGEVDVGAGAAFLSVHPSGKFLFASSYSDGQVTVNRIHEDGSLSTNPLQLIKTDANAHSIVGDPSGRFIFVSHTIPNTITQFLFDPQTGLLAPNTPAQLKREASTGPRHFSFHPRLHIAYGSDEQGISLSAYEMDPSAGRLSLIETLSSLPTSRFEGKGTAAHVEVHPSGNFVYISNRGPNTLAGFTINPVTGRLTPLQQTPVEPVPRSFNISPDGRFLVAVGEKSGKLRVFRILPDGRLELTQTIDTHASPWWVSFQP